MKFVILNTDYPTFLADFYQTHPGLDHEPYEKQMRARAQTLFGVADFYSSNLRRLGHEAEEIHFNNEAMQQTWAREHGLAIEKKTLREFRFRRGIVPWIFSRPDDRWLYKVLGEQIRQAKPDIVLNQAMDGISSQFMAEIKPFTRLLAGQLAAPLPKDAQFGCYDLIISSLPNYVEHFRSLGIAAELSGLAFDPRVLQALNESAGGGKTVDVSFVGSLSPDHHSRIELLEYLCGPAGIDIRLWGQGAERFPSNSPIRARHNGAVWGIPMYQVLRNSRITLNHHIGISGNYANNMRLYEATGVGAMLLTDLKENLHDIFEPGKEVVAYNGKEECASLIKHYLSHEQERASIASAGQQRTLRDHTYAVRARELVDIVARHL